MDASGGSIVGDVTLTGTLTVDVQGAQAITSPLTVDGDLTLSDAEVNFLNYTNIEPERWQTFLTATGTATGDFARDNLTGPYLRRKSGSSYALVHSSGMMIIFR